MTREEARVAWRKKALTLWAITALMISATLGMLWAQREPPSYIGRQYVVPDAEPGTTFAMVVPVTRHLDRECSVDVDRSFIDSSGTADTIINNQHVSAEALAKREADTPGRISVNVPVPATAKMGPAKVRTENQYRCLWNPTTWLWKVETTWYYDVNVVPPGTLKARAQSLL